MILRSILRYQKNSATLMVILFSQIVLVLSSCSNSPTEVKNVVSISITPETFTFTRMNQNLQLTAQAFDDGGNLIPNREFTWQSSDTNIVQVISSSLGQANVVPKSNGSATITAESDARTGQASLRVKVVSSVNLTPQNHVFKDINQTQQFQATASGPDGRPVTDIPLIWGSRDENVATADTNGLVTSVASGATVITATYDEGSFRISDSSEVVVDLVPPVTGKWNGVIPGLGFILDLTENTDASISGDGLVFIASGGAVLVFGVSVSGSIDQANITLLITTPVINPTTFTGVVNSDASQMDGRLTTAQGLDVAFTFNRDQDTVTTSQMSTSAIKQNLLSEKNPIDVEKLLRSDSLPR